MMDEKSNIHSSEKKNVVQGCLSCLYHQIAVGIAYFKHQEDARRRSNRAITGGVCAHKELIYVKKRLFCSQISRNLLVRAKDLRTFASSNKDKDLRVGQA